MTPTRLALAEYDIEIWKDTRTTAYHGAGHAVLHVLCGVPFITAEVFSDDHPGRDVDQDYVGPCAKHMRIAIRTPVRTKSGDCAQAADREASGHIPGRTVEGGRGMSKRGTIPTVRGDGRIRPACRDGRTPRVELGDPPGSRRRAPLARQSRTPRAVSAIVQVDAPDILVVHLCRIDQLATPGCTGPACI